MESLNGRYCADCGAPAHPASGAEYSPTWLVCGRCVRQMWSWVKGHTNQRKLMNKSERLKPREDQARIYFYEAAGRWNDE